MAAKTKKYRHNQSVFGLQTLKDAFFDITIGKHKKTEFDFSIYNKKEINFAIALVKMLETLDNSLWSTASEEELIKKKSLFSQPLVRVMRLGF